MANLGTLTLDLIAKIGGFTGPLDKAERQAKKSSRAIKGSVDSALSSLKAWAIGIGSPAAVIAFTKSSIDAASSINDVSKAAGISTDTLQEMRHAASLSGISFDELDGGMQKFSKSLGDLKAGSGALYSYLKKTDEALLAQVKSAKSTDEALNVMFGALKNVTDENQRAALSAAAFGRSGQKLSVLANDYENLRQQARDLGLVIDSELIENADEAGDKLDILSQVIKTQLTTALLELAPTITTVSQGLIDIINLIPKMQKKQDQGRLVDLERLKADIEIIKFALKDAEDSGKESFVTISKDGIVLTHTIESAKQSVKELTDSLEKLGNIQSGKAPTKAIVAATGLSEEELKEQEKRLKKLDQLQKQMGENATRWGEEQAQQYWEDNQKELDSLQQFYDDKLDMEKMYAEQLEDIETELTDLRKELNTTYWDEYLQSLENNMGNMDSIVGDTLDNFTSQFGDFFSSAIMDSENLGDAFKNMAEGMARSILSAVGQMIAQWAVMAIAKKAISAATTAASVAEAGITATAWAPAASAVSLATFGANAAPAAAGISSTYALTSGLALIGMAHEGMDSVPETGTWLLQKGERVATRNTSAKLDNTLSKIQTQMNTTNNSRELNTDINNNFNFNGMTFLSRLQIREIVDMIEKEMTRKKSRLGM